MNSFERVVATLQGLPVDRAPVFGVLGAMGGRLTGTDLRTLYSNADAYVAGQIAVQEKFGLDMALVAFDYGAIAEAFGGEVAWFENQAPNMKKPCVYNASDLLSLKIPDPYKAFRLPVHLDAARQLSNLFQKKLPVFAAVPGPAVLPTLLLGLERWIEILLFEEENAQRILEFTGTFFVAWSNALLAQGVMALVVTESVASQEIAHRNLFAEKLLPHVRDMFSCLQGPVVFHHGGGRLLHVLDLIPGLPNVIGVVVSSKDNLAESRKKLGSELLLIGNLDNLSFTKEANSALESRSLECLRQVAHEGRFALSNSAADIPMSSAFENIHSMLSASCAFGPIGVEGCG